MRIAIVKLSALGDIVHAMVVLQFIKKFNKEISIDWIVEETYKELSKTSVEVFYNEIKSIHGHDAFLIEFDQIDKILRPIFNMKN